METLISKSIGKQMKQSKNGYKPSLIIQKMFADLFVYSDTNFELEKLFSFSHNCGILTISKAEVISMPEISLFCGIRITMFYSDHNPPHFHAEYAGQKALVDIQEGCVIRGALPARQLKLILAWCELHRDELMQNWELSKDTKPLKRINPLM